MTPFSKNKRVVTVIDTDVEGGTQVGLVAMIEVVALIIGEVVQCRPGSSTNVLLFQPRRVRFLDDLLANQRRATFTAA